MERYIFIVLSKYAQPMENIRELKYEFLVHRKIYTWAYDTHGKF